MKIPNKAHDAFLDRNDTYLYYMVGQKEFGLKLPKWLSRAIENARQMSYERGKGDLRTQIKNALNI